MKTKDLIYVSVIFYIGWFGSVFLAKTSYSVAALVFPLALFVFLYFKVTLKVKEIVVAIAISIFGIFFDTFISRYGLTYISGHSSLLIPAWLISIWLLFSLSMIKLGSRLRLPIWVAALLGGFMGPLSYKSGEYFEVLSFNSSYTFLVYAIFWSILFPLTLSSAKRIS